MATTVLGDTQLSVRMPPQLTVGTIARRPKRGRLHRRRRPGDGQWSNLVVTGSVDLSDGPHSFTLAVQRIDILEGPGCPTVTDAPAP